MLQVNRAYAANDLLSLLELQLQIEQVDAAHIARGAGGAGFAGRGRNLYP